MKIIITGAHFTPAVATIEHLKKYKDVKIVYVGRRTTREGDSSKSVESQVLPDLGIKFIPIITGRLQKDFTFYTIPSLLKIPIGFLQAFNVLLKEKPDAILSFGGYVAIPLVFVGWLLSIPIMVHEQTLVSGLANKISGLLATKVALSFKTGRLTDKTIITGNPIRKIILNPPALSPEYKNLFNLAQKQKLHTILVTGGNQGSHTINIHIGDCIESLTKIACVIHITGDNKFQDFERLSKLGNFNGRYLVKKWIDEQYGAIAQNVDLVISRAGANTLTELAFLGKPAIVIPIPYLYKDEQNENAKYFANLGLVKVLPQNKLSPKTLLDDSRNCLKNLVNLKRKATEAKKIIIQDAAQRLALETILLA